MLNAAFFLGYAPNWRGIVAFCAVALLPFLLLLDTAVALSRGWRARSRLDLAFTLAVALAVILVCSILIIPQGRAFLYRHWASLALLSSVMALAWFIAETAAAAALPRLFPHRSHLGKPGAKLVFRTRPGAVQGISEEAHYTVNSLGIRGAEPPPRDEAYRILCIGGGNTACKYLDDRATWPHLLMQGLNAGLAPRRVWVGNAGVGGLSSVHRLEFVRRSPLVPRMDCLVLMAGVHEFLDASHWRPAYPGPLWCRSGSLLLAREAYQARTDESVEDLVDEIQQGVRRRREAPASDWLPDLEQSLKAYGERLSVTVKAGRRRGVRLVFASQPVLWEEPLSDRARSSLLLGRLPDGDYLTVERLREGSDRFNETLRGVCEARGAEYVDLACMSGREEFFYDDCHFTLTGAQELARLLADWFVRQEDIAGRRIKVS